MVGQEAAQLEDAAIDLAEPFQRDADRAIGVFQVAISCHRPDVDPLAQVGVAQEAIVVLVAIALDDAGLDLAADPADRPDRRLGQDARPRDNRPRADRRRPLDKRERLDMRRVDHHRPVACVQHQRAVEPGGRVDIDLGRVADDHMRVVDRALGRRGPAALRNKERQIAPDLLAVGGDKIPGEGQ
jgi:hypothetical protein